MDMPDKVGRYEIRGLLGRGGMGNVYKAWDPIFERHVALKTISPQFYNDPEFRKRFHTEAKAAAKLKHPNIVEIHDWVEENDRAYQVLELLEGTSLKEKIRADTLAREGKPEGIAMSLKDKLEAMIGVCKGLKKAHQNGIIHRDIKPENVFMTDEGAPKILDFGLARIGTMTSMTTGPMGTPAYMSPEQFAYLDVDHRTDIWSCGVMLYELLCNALPFPGKEYSTIARKVLYSEPQPLKIANPLLPEELTQIVTRALTKDREKRYQDVTELERELSRFLNSLQSDKSDTDKTVVSTAASQLLELVRENQQLLRSNVLEGLLVLEDPVDKRLLTLAHREMKDAQMLASTYPGYLEQIHERLLAVLPNLRRVHALYTQATELEQAEKLEEALSVVAGLCREFPDLKVAAQLYERIKVKHERKRWIHRLYRQAEQVRQQGNLAGARELLERALKVEPTHRALLSLYQEVLSEIEGRRKEVASTLRLAQAAEKQGQLQKALELAQSALEMDQTNTEILDLMGRIESKLHGAGDVLEILKKANQLAEAGQEQEALDCLHEIFASAPHHRQAQELKSRIEAKHRDQEIATPGLIDEREEVGSLGQRATAPIPQEPGPQEVRRTPPRSPAVVSGQVDSLLQQARNLDRVRHYELALKRIHSVLEIEPSNEAALELKRSIEDKLSRTGLVQRVLREVKARPLATAAVFIIVAAISIGIVVLPDGNDGPVPAPSEMGRVWVDIAPWAKIVSIRDSVTGEMMSPEHDETPCLLFLPNGSYEIQFWNHFRPKEPLQLVMEVKAGETLELKHPLPGFDDEQIPLDF